MSDSKDVQVMKIIAIGMAALLMAGCATDGADRQTTAGPVPHSHPEMQRPYTQDDVVPRSMCSSVAYEEDHDRWLSQTAHIREQVLLNPPTQADRSRRSPDAYGNPQSGQVPDATYLVEQFEAELDGSFDSIIQSCRVYNQCMIQNNYTESSCTQSAGMWAASQDRFHQLSETMAVIRAQIAQSCSDCGARNSRSTPQTTRRRANEGQLGGFSGGR
jgi:hypothetical protein